MHFNVSNVSFIVNSKRGIPKEAYIKDKDNKNVYFYYYINTNTIYYNLLNDGLGTQLIVY